MGSPRNQSIGVFVATWNVGGKSPHFSLNLDDFLQTNEPSDLYILGFQEIVPLNAGNVLVIEDNEPAAKWLTLINNSLNKSEEAEVSSTAISQLKAPGNLLFFQKPSLKEMSKIFRTEPVRNLKTCNCYSECRTRYVGDSNANEEDSSTEDDESSNLLLSSGDLGYSTDNNQLRYGLVISKQMVGIFLTIWAKKELVPHIRHLRLSCIGRGILGYLGNKGCIAVSMSLYETSFCFICSHLTSGEKEGDEIRRNFDVIEILKNTQFRRFSKIPRCKIPKRIIDHDRVIWLGDLNYRIALSYKETRKLLDHGDWDSLLEKDQLRIEREAGRVFSGWNEGQICFPPTYKYSKNSDKYTGESIECRKKRRTPAWCDRILWHGDGILQLSYVRNESRFSDHRPVNAIFSVEISAFNGKEAFIQF